MPLVQKSFLLDDENENKSKSRAILEAAPDAMIIINNQGEIILSNAQIENIFGYKEEEILGQKIEILIPARYKKVHPKHRDNYFHDPHVRPMGMGLQLYGLHKKGHEFPVEISLSPLVTEQGTLGLAAIRDITERKRFEEALKEKNDELENAIMAKDRFLATMSHELRTPLNAIIGFTGTLLMRLPGALNDEQEKHLSIVQNSAKHLLSLINDILDFAKVGSGKIELSFEGINCKHIIRNVVNTLRPLCQNKDLRLTSILPEEEIQVRADTRALTQIILNLTNNAIKFTEKGGIDIELATITENEKKHVVIMVKDTGIGIQQRDQENLFKAFHQISQPGNKKIEGTGLGLHLSQKLASLNHGRIECESTLGVGSCFSLILPKHE